MAETTPYEIAYKGNLYQIVQDKAYSMQGADKHNAILKANVYYELSAQQANDIANGSFASLYIGDRFVINDHGYTIAAFNYKKNHEQNLDLPNHMLLLSDIIGRYSMGDYDDTSKGWGGTAIFNNIFPKVIVPQLQKDWGDHLLTFKSFVSTSCDGNGAPNQGEWRSLQANMCNAMMFLGDTTYSNSANGTKFNLGDENTQLPLTKLKPDEKKSWMWSRDVYDSSDFAASAGDGSASCAHASFSRDVRAYFLIS